MTSYARHFDFFRQISLFIVCKPVWLVWPSRHALLLAHKQGVVLPARYHPNGLYGTLNLTYRHFNTCFYIYHQPLYRPLISPSIFISSGPLITSPPPSYVLYISHFTHPISLHIIFPLHLSLMHIYPSPCVLLYRTSPFHSSNNYFLKLPWLREACPQMPKTYMYGPLALNSVPRASRKKTSSYTPVQSLSTFNFHSPYSQTCLF